MKPSSKPPKPDKITPLEAVLLRLDISAAELSRTPQITDMLKGAFGTKDKAIAALRFSADPAANSFFEVFDELSGVDQKAIPIEAVCLKAQISPATVVGAVLMAARQVKGQESALRAILAHPEVVKATIRSAKLIGKDGDNSKKMLHEAVGFLPTKTGQNINVNLLGGNPQYGAPQLEEGEDLEDDDASFREAFPSVNQNLEEWSENRRTLLTDGK